MASGMSNVAGQMESAFGSSGLAGMERDIVFHNDPLFDSYREIARASFVDGTIDIIKNYSEFCGSVFLS